MTREERRKRRRERLNLRHRNLLPGEIAERRRRRKERKAAGGGKGQCQIEGHVWPNRPTRVPRLEGSLLHPSQWQCGKCGFLICQRDKPQRKLFLQSTIGAIYGFKRTKGVIALERTTKSTESASVSRGDLKILGRELNKVLGLEPQINLTADDLEGPLTEAIDLLQRSDRRKMSEEALQILDTFKDNGVSKSAKGENGEDSEGDRGRPSRKERREMAKAKRKEEESEGKGGRKAKAEKEPTESNGGGKKGNLLTAIEAAERVGLTKQQIRRAARRGKLEAIKEDNGRVMFRPKDVDSFAKDLKSKEKDED